MMIKSCISPEHGWQNVFLSEIRDLCRRSDDELNEIGFGPWTNESGLRAMAAIAILEVRKGILPDQTNLMFWLGRDGE